MSRATRFRNKTRKRGRLQVESALVFSLGRALPRAKATSSQATRAVLGVSASSKARVAPKNAAATRGIALARRLPDCDLSHSNSFGSTHDVDKIGEPHANRDEAGVAKCRQQISTHPMPAAFRGPDVASGSRLVENAPSIASAQARSENGFRERATKRYA